MNNTNTNLTSEDKKLLQQLYKHRDEAEIVVPEFDDMWQKADHQKNRNHTFWYLRAAAMLAVVITGLLWSYFTLNTTQPTPEDWPENLYSTWQLPSDELLVMSIYETSYTNIATPTNYLLNPNNEVYYENTNPNQN